MEDAVESGERSSLDRSQEKKDLFLQNLAQLLEITPVAAQSEVINIRENFNKYYQSVVEHANLLLESGEEVEGLGRLSDEAMLKESLENELKQLSKEQEEQVNESLLAGMQETRRQSRRILVLGTAAFLLPLILLVYFARRIVLPIRSLSMMTAGVAKGTLDRKTNIPLLKQDEVGNLEASFRAMMQGLKETTVLKAYVDNIIKSMVDSLIVATPEGAFQTVNQATLNLLGYEENELLGKSIEMIFANEEFKVSVIDDLIQEGFISNVEHIYLAKDGMGIPVSFSSSVMRDEKDEIQGIVCVAQDITERKRTEEALRETKRPPTESRWV
jgi:PAS domain S-box-containing protein